jgi:CBS domain-containing protein
VELCVDQVTSRPVETVTPTTPLRDAAEEMLRHALGAVVVVDGANRFQGLLTATDFVLLAAEGDASADAAVAEVMRTDVVTTDRRAPATTSSTRCSST